MQVSDEPQSGAPIEQIRIAVQNLWKLTHAEKVG